MYLKGYDNTCSLCLDDEIKQINLFYPRDHIYFLGISYSRLDVEESISEDVMLSILLFLGVTHSEAAGNGRNETELHFTHIRFLYDM